MKDRYIDELHKIREAYAKKFGYDLDAMFEDLKEKEKQHKDRIVNTGKKRTTKAA